MPADLARRFGEELFAQRGEELLQGGPRRRLHEELRALVVGALGDDVRYGVVDADLVGPVDGADGIAQEAHRIFELARLGAQGRFEDERRKAGAATIDELGIREAGEVMPRERGEKR